MSSVCVKVPQKVTELWFEDANVIIQAGAKLFLVHRSILAARSAIFKDMFAVPQPRNATQDTAAFIDDIKGCAFISLPDDETEVQYFLLAIFDASFFEGPPSSPSIEIIIAILRLSSKYEVPFLKRRAVNHLNVLFPTTRLGYVQSFRTCLQPYLLNGRQVDLLPLFELALSTETRWIIPTVYAVCNQIDLRQLFLHPSWKQMSLGMQETYLLARYHGEFSIPVWLLPANVVQNCVRPGPCRKFILGWTQEWMLGLPSMQTTQAPMWPTPQDASWKTFKKGLCNLCASNVEQQYNEVADQRWDVIPGKLGLPGWDVLNAEKAAFGSLA